METQWGFLVSEWFVVSFYTTGVGNKKPALGGLEKCREKRRLLLWHHPTTANGFQHNIIHVVAHGSTSVGSNLLQLLGWQSS